ncbi:MAG: ABC transporter substrate-binding protein [Treponemataceae bacterium]|nr:ABC transporter substrate-binding protein [Treponemataceae bacterium]
MKNKIVALVLLSALLASAAFAGGSKDSAKKGGYDQVTFTYATFNNIPSEEALDAVEEAINVITREKIGVEVTLQPIFIFEYSNKVRLALQGGEKIDLFQSLGDFNQCVSTDMTYDLTDIFDTCAPEMKALVGADWLNATSRDGRIYGVPTYKPVALTPMLIYREDIAQELGLDISKVNSIQDVTAVLRAVKKAKPNMTPLAPVQTGEIGLAVNYGEVDFLTDDRYTPIGVLEGNSLKVVDLYSTDTFKSLAKMARSWYNEGLVMKDAATTTSAAAELMSSGNYFAYIAAYSYPEADTAVMMSAQAGNLPFGCKMLGDAYLSTADLNAVSWMVSSMTDVPEAALKFLNLTYTDPDVVNLIINGIKDRDYVMDADGYIAYPDGMDATTVPYTAQLSCGTLGNFFIMYPGAGTSKDSLAWELEQNKTAKTSPAMGFTFDSSNLKTQYTAVQNVLTQYLPGLVTGSLDPDTELPKFIKALNDAGYQDILKEKQAQLDAWVKASK